MKHLVFLVSLFLLAGCAQNRKTPISSRISRETARTVFAECSHPRHVGYYWLTGSYKNYEPDSEDSDHWALDNGYVAITPTKIDVTAYELMEKMKSWNWE